MNEHNYFLLKSVIRVLKGKLSGKRTYTYCSRLWDAVFINELGDVYACCHLRSGILGNIYKNNLSDIWNKSLRLKLLRWLSLNGCLGCIERCQYFTKRMKESTVKHTAALGYPNSLHIQYGTRCNINCKMCLQDHRTNTALDNDVLKTRIDWSRIRNVALQGGEILAMKNAKESCLWLMQQGNIKLGLITNGLLINDEWVDYIIKGSAWIEISVNAATEEMYRIVNQNEGFNKVINNLKKLIQRKHDCGSGIRIQYHFTIIPQNISEIPDAILKAAELGCDMVTYCYDDPAVPDFFSDNEQIRIQVRSRIKQIFQDGNVKIKIRRIPLDNLSLVDDSLHGNLDENIF